MAAAVRQVIEAAGAKLRYLPKYSPDLNPIEQAFSKLGAAVHKQPNEPSRASLAQDWRYRDRIQPSRMDQLLPTCRLRFHVTGIRL